MKRLLVLIILIPLIMISIHCSKPGEIHLKGKIFYTNGSWEIKEVDFMTSMNVPAFRNLYHGPDFITFLSKVNNGNIIFSSVSPISAPILKLYNTSNNEVQNLGEGISPVYIPEKDLLIYMKAKKPYGTKGEGSLYIGSLAHLNDSKLICKKSNGDSSLRMTLMYRPVVSIGGERVVFCGLNEIVTEYNYTNGEIKQTDIQGLYPLIWRQRSNELLCCDKKEENFSMIEWTSKKRRTIDLGNLVYDGFVYIQDEDLLLFTTEMGETLNLNCYDFKNSTVRKFLPNTYMLDGIYFPADSIN